MDVRLTKKKKRNYILFSVTKYHFDTPLGPITYTYSPLIPEKMRFKYSEEFRSNFEIDPYILISPSKMRQLGEEARFRHDFRQIRRIVKKNLEILSSVHVKAMEIFKNELEKELEQLKKQLEEYSKKV